MTQQTDNSIEIDVVTIRMNEAKEALDKLIKKAKRYKATQVGYSVSAPFDKVAEYVDWDGEIRRRSVSFVTFTVWGPAPTVGDYEFLAKIEFVDGKPILQHNPQFEDDLDHRFRETTTRCEHCNTNRIRNEVFVVRNRETGEQIQVGRTCLQDYLGVSPAAAISAFRWFKEVRDQQDEEWGRPFSCVDSTLEVLTVGLAAIRVFGWASKSQAYYDSSIIPTASYVYLLFARDDTLTKSQKTDRDAIRAEIDREKDEAEAARIIKWVKDKYNEGTTNDFIHNLATVLSSESLEQKHRGLALAAIPTYYKAQEQELARQKEFDKQRGSRWIGDVGERFRGVAVTKIDARFIRRGQYGDVFLNKFMTDEGDVLAWWSGVLVSVPNGTKLVLDFTVKDHDEYKGIQSTKISRAKYRSL